MATVPTVPSFVTGETPSITKLNQLASCATFISVVPAFAQLSVTSQTITSGSVTALSWAKTTDRDGGWSAGNPTRYTSQTPAYYQLEALVMTPSTAAGDRIAYFQVTTGANNPGGAGNTVKFGAQSALTTVTAAQFTISALSPYMYVLDYVEVYTLQTSGANESAAGCTFQATLVSLGP